MQRKFQIFVSSTYIDLIDERQGILRAILDLGHIPAGMEGFYAADEEQLSYIKRIIDECDYYVIVIAGRYGAVDSMNVSYTEREYDYALSKNLTILAFIHSDINSIASVNVESKPDTRSKLESFKRKVSEKRLVSFWKTRDQLSSSVIISLSKAIASSPGTGWIRGDKAATEDVLQSINAYREENDALRKSVTDLKSQLSPKVENIAPMESVFNIRYRFYKNTTKSYVSAEVKPPWTDIFGSVAPSLTSPVRKSVIESCIKNYIVEKSGNQHLTYLAVPESDLDTIKVQLSSYGLVRIYSGEAINGGVSELLVLTDLGRQVMHDVLTVRNLPSNCTQDES